MIEGREVEFKPGENLIEVAKRAGVEIPYFCYHPGLSVVAQCRMCAVEVGMPGKDGTVQMMPKLQTACSTPPADGMHVKAKTDKVLQNQKSVMEFLLINHPLDCPVCDKSGECDLQDNSYKHGDAYMRTTEERRTYVDLDMGPVIKKNMNRCIHCTRCIRFGEEIAGIREMVAIQRGNNTEITTIDGKPLETEYAGNYADICPTGSLTLKDFRFRKRAWFLKKTPTVCEGCSRGCNIELHHEANVIYRTIPRINMEINRHWICDEGRFNFHYVHDAERVTEPALSRAGALTMTTWKEALSAARAALKGQKVVLLAGADLSQEEGKLLLEVSGRIFGGAPVFHFGTPGVFSSAEDAPADALLKRKSKVANLHGLEKLGIQGFKALPAGTQAVVVFRGGRAALPSLSGVEVYGVGVFKRQEAAQFAAVLPGLAFAEKDGSVVNFQGVEQKLRRAIAPPRECKSLSETLMMWANA
ncbi:MAG: 2Fe-2S iron-sulfur cluster-binding protein [Oligoflexia bacterium]